MRCMNCGLPLSPSRTLTNCPRCGASLNVFQGAQQQFEQTGQESGRGAVSPQNLWGQGSSPTSGSYSSFPPQNPGQMGGSGSSRPEPPLPPKRPYTPQTSKSNARLLFIAATLCVFLAAMILGLVYVLASSNTGSPSNTANTGSNSTGNAATTTPASTTAPTTSATPDVGVSPTGTVYPGQQYISSAQMADGVDQKTMQPQNPTTTFKVGSSMYVVFSLHPSSQGGAVCSYWYLDGKQVTSYPVPVKSTSQASYTYATYDSAGQGYVELYWASDKSCANQILAQHVDFTVTL